MVAQTGQGRLAIGPQLGKLPHAECEPRGEDGGVFEPREHPQEHLLFEIAARVGVGETAQGPAGAVLRGDYFAAAGGAAKLIRRRVLLLEGEQSSLQILESVLADAFYQRRERDAALT